MAGGGISWVNIFTDGVWGTSDSGNAYSSSDPDNMLTPDLSQRYQVDLSSVADEDDHVFRTQSSTGSVDIVGVFGVTADSADDLDQLEVKLVGPAAFDTSSSSEVDNAGWASPDGEHGGLVWTLDAAQTITQLRLHIRRADAAAWDGDWIGFGHIWGGLCIRWASEPAIGRDWAKRPVLNDLQWRTPGGGSKGRARARLQDTLVRIIDLQGDQMARSGQTLEAMYAYAGNTGSVALAVRSGESHSCAYGTLTQPPAPTHEFGDYWSQSVAIRERR